MCTKKAYWIIYRSEQAPRNVDCEYNYTSYALPYKSITTHTLSLFLSFSLRSTSAGHKIECFITLAQDKNGTNRKAQIEWALRCVCSVFAHEIILQYSYTYHLIFPNVKYREENQTSVGKKRKTRYLCVFVIKWVIPLNEFKICENRKKNPSDTKWWCQ